MIIKLELGLGWGNRKTVDDGQRMMDDEWWAVDGEDAKTAGMRG